MKKAAKIILLIVVLFSGLVPSRSAHADVAPNPEIKLGGLHPYQETEVQMIYERVEMELEMFSDENFLVQNRVIVNAYFVMKNLGTEDESMHVVFPPEIAPFCHGEMQGETFTSYFILQDSFEISVDGIIVPTFMLEAPYGDCGDFSWLAFDVTFPVQKEILIKVSYAMETWSVDSAQNIDYILDTGAGWKGNIGRGYIIFKLPYTVTSENILSNTTQGYQSLYNEIFWSFQDLEPTPDDNIHISIVSPNIWLEILELRKLVKNAPDNSDAWLDLINIYRSIAFDQKEDFILNEYYYGLIIPSYQDAIAKNPNNAEILAQYAQFILDRQSPRLMRLLTNNEVDQILVPLNKALALDPNNETAKFTLSNLRAVAPSLTFTPPATIPPTATSKYTATPSITPTATITPLPSETPFVVTVVHTKIVKYPKVITATPESKIPMVTRSPAEAFAQSEPQEPSTTPLVFGALFIFVAGVGAGVFWQRRRS